VEFETKDTYILTRFWIPREGNPSLLERLQDAHRLGLEAVRTVLDDASRGVPSDVRAGLTWEQLEKEIADDCENSDARCEDVLVRLKVELDGERLKRWPENSTPGA
jgi:hypothetical protein